MGASGSKPVEAPSNAPRPIAGSNSRGESEVSKQIAKHNKFLETQQKKIEHLEAQAEKEKVKAFQAKARNDKTGMCTKFHQSCCKKERELLSHLRSSWYWHGSSLFVDFHDLIFLALTNP